MKHKLEHPASKLVVEADDSNRAMYESQGWRSASRKSDRVDDILAAVGNDRVKAREALALEQEKGDKARPSLVEKLAALAG